MDCGGLFYEGKRLLTITSNPTIAPAPAFALIESWKDVFSKLAYYFSHRYTIGNLEGSVTSLIGGAIIFAVAVLLSRTLSKILQRRIAKRAFLDPGLHYTIGRLTQYLIITLGALLG